MSVRFAGFPSEGMEFLKKLARNNKREWFQPRKEDFERYVKTPMLDLVTALNQDLAKFAPNYITEPKRAVFRIYRDTRFSNDKTPYKTHIAAVFVRRGMEKHTGGMYYIAISPKEVEVAGGIHQPDKEQTMAIRACMLDCADEFRKICAAPKLRKLMGELKGAELSRMPKGFDSGHPAADLIRKKEWLHYVPLDPSVASTPALQKEIVERFRSMLPVIEFLNQPLIDARAVMNGLPVDRW